MSDWRPSSSFEVLKLRAALLAQAREFFSQRKVLEVETPLLGLHTVTEPNIDSIQVIVNAEQRYLQTSPEYAMKRLLAAGGPDCYQICKSFRFGEQGKQHNPEFTLIEWYRRDFDLEKIIHETVALIANLLSDSNLSEKAKLMTYSEAFEKTLGKPFHDLSEEELKTIATQKGLLKQENFSTDQYLDFIFSNYIVPSFSDTLTVIYHYPASQAALAKLNLNKPGVAERFEVFYKGIELANGYCELLDADEQKIRFEKDQETRQVRDLSDVAIDQRLIEAQRHGLPECSGVALGLDRVLMLASGVSSINEVLSFDWLRA